MEMLSLLLYVRFFMESSLVLAGCLCRFLCHYLLVLLFVFAGKGEKYLLITVQAGSRVSKLELT